MRAKAWVCLVGMLIAASLAAATNQPIVMRAAMACAGGIHDPIECGETQGPVVCIEFLDAAVLDSIVVDAVVLESRHDVTVSVYAERGPSGEVVRSAVERVGYVRHRLAALRLASSGGLSERSLIVPVGDYLIPIGWRVFVAVSGVCAECCVPNEHRSITADVTLWAHADRFVPVSGPAVGSRNERSGDEQ